MCAGKHARNLLRESRMKQKNAFWKRLATELTSIQAKQALPRMAADLILVNASLVIAFTIWYFAKPILDPASDTIAMARSFKALARSYWPLWSLLALIVFYVNGFYTRTRLYTRRYKSLVIFRAATLFVVMFVFLDSFLDRSNTMPRGVAVLAWLLTLATVGGLRLAKMGFLRRYRIEPRHLSTARVERVLVVGGAGYVGSTLVPMLLEGGYKVSVLDSLLFGKESLEEFKEIPHFELLQGDMRNIQCVVEAMRDCQSVIHLAAIVGDPACEEDRLLAIETNRAATQMLIDVARGYRIRRFLFASTCSVYGASDFLVDEHTYVNPISTYARTKVDSEMLLLAAANGEFHPTILRLGTLFGLSRRPRFDLVVNLLAARAAETGRITIFNGDQWRPFMHVRDAARAFIACLVAPLKLVSGEVFNIGSYELNHKLSEVSEAISRIIPTTQVHHVENPDRRSYRVSFDKIHFRLSFTCKISLEEGIREICEAIRSAQITDIDAPIFNNQMMTRVYAQTADARRSTLSLWKSLVSSQELDFDQILDEEVSNGQVKTYVSLLSERRNSPTN